MSKNQLSVKLKGKLVGTLEQTASGKMTFTYSKAAKNPVSLSMPVREEPYGEDPTEAYFGGLLPESENVRMLIGKKYGINHNNNFALLKTIGYDCAGAVSCHPFEEADDESPTFPLTAQVISDSVLYKQIKSLPKNPLFLGVDDLRLSLAGVQDKAAVCLLDDKIAFAENGCPTTHILKPSSLYFEGMAENEYFCLRIAKQLGLPIPAIQLRQIKDTTFLLIERYDRRISNNHVERIHQEDFCQALGISSNKKYQNEGGPGFKACFDLLKESANPARDRNLLASALVFNYLICNMDAHAKNFSLLHNSINSTVILAPFYDLVCTRAYPKLTSKMAMSIGKKYEADDIVPRYWEQLCKDVDYRYPSIKQIILEYGESILKIAAEEKKLSAIEDRSKIIDKIIKTIKKNINLTLKVFAG